MNKSYIVFQASTEEELPVFLDFFFTQEAAEQFVAKYDIHRKWFIETHQETEHGHSEIISISVADTQA